MHIYEDEAINIIHLKAIAKNLAFCFNYFTVTYNMLGEPDIFWDIEERYEAQGYLADEFNGPGALTVIEIKSDIWELADFYMECDRFFDNYKLNERERFFDANT